ncbi:MAG TPA: DedA family protein [Allosphingosinicella sp.]|nr:DedA family protein [Allosphingosinicella sp.]
MSDWVIQLIDRGGYAAVFALMLLETIFPPIPSEVILPVAGMRAADGPLGLGGVVAAASAGAMTGNFIWYLVARAIGLDRFRHFIEHYGRWLSLDWYDIEKVQRLFGRFGAGIVFIGRMLPTVRTFVSVPAGLIDMNLARFLIWSTVGTALWSGALAGLGYLLQREFSVVEKVAGPVTSVIVIGVALWYVWRQLTWRRRHPKPVAGRPHI